jgi:hypothetical protein
VDASGIDDPDAVAGPVGSNIVIDEDDASGTLDKDDGVGVEQPGATGAEAKARDPDIIDTTDSQETVRATTVGRQDDGGPSFR